MGTCSSQPKTTERRTGAHRAGSHATRFQANRDRFQSVEEVQSALRTAGLESSDVILAVDLTKSNEWSGKSSFHGECLHSTKQATNPYKSVMNIICKTMAAFDDDHLIPTFGFGDHASKDHSLITFDPHGYPIHTLENVLHAYDNVISKVNLSGPTSFAPAIHKAIEIVREAKGQYHILVVIADGQVSGGACMSNTVAAICEASHYALSIIMIGVGDGPWDQMRQFDDMLPERKFDNFQFVNFTALGRRAAERDYSAAKWEADFALAALMEIPDQYAAICNLGLLGKQQYSRPAQHVEVMLPTDLGSSHRHSFADSRGGASCADSAASAASSHTHAYPHVCKVLSTET